MALPNITAVNQTGSPITIADLGVTVPASGSLLLTETLLVDEITNSPDLHVEVDAGNLIVNINGTDLTSEQSRSYLEPASPDVEIRNNFSATMNPGAGDDDNAGYSVGSAWTNTTTGEVFFCVDASSGAAVWEPNVPLLADVLGAGNSTGGTDITLSAGDALVGADGSLVINGIRHYGKSATDPVSPAPAEGDAYYNTALQMDMRYDATRGKWLSAESAFFQFGRNGSVGANGTYLRAINGMFTGPNRGYDLLYNGTVVGMSIRRTTNSSATYAITATGTDIVTLAYTSGPAVRTTTADGDFSQGDVLACRLVVDGAAPEDNVQVSVRVKWRL